MNRIAFFVLLSILILAGCGNQGVSAVKTVPVEAFNPESFVLTDIPGSSIQRAERRDTSGALLEEGFLSNGKRTGTWVTYHPGTAVPKTIVNYINDQYNGLYIELNDRGYLELRAEYKNNLLDGPWAKYRFGRPLTEAFYANGKLNGFYREYVLNTGKLQKEISYKDGVIDGPFRFYNEEGVVTLEYQYRNGEKVGGGIVDPARPNPSR